MSIIHASSTVANAARKAGSFNPNIIGRVHGDGYVVIATDIDFQFSPDDANANQYVYLWLVKTATDCEIRVARWQTSPANNWYNAAGVAQGDPGTSTTVFTLGAVPDTVNIYNANDNSIALTPTFTTYGTSYTSDDKSTFFNPTQDTAYGRRIQCQAIVTGIGELTETGECTIQFTFRKSGDTDYTVTFRSRCTVTATVEI